MNDYELCFNVRVRYTDEFIDNVYDNELRLEDQAPEDAERPLYNLYNKRTGKVVALTHQPGVLEVLWDDQPRTRTKVHIGNIQTLPEEDA